MDLTSRKTTAEVAADLCIGPDKIRSILDRYPMDPPPKFGTAMAWSEDDILILRAWLLYDKDGTCPKCGATIEKKKAKKAKPEGGAE